MKYLIIGNSAAGINAADAIRSLDKSGKITMLSNEEFPAYGRPLISYFLSGKVKAEKMYYRDENFYKSRDIELLLNTGAKKIDAKNRVVITEKEKELPYDRLLIAAGSVPFIPKIKNLGGQKNVFTFLTYKDSINIKQALKKDSKVVIAGGGLIGLKAAEGVFGQAGKITVIDKADRIMASVLDKPAADIIKSHIASNDIEFKLNVSLTEVEGKENVHKIHLSNGETLECDILIMAVGVLPNVKIAADAGIKIVRGIVVDEYMRTSEKGIFAAGDCVESLDLLSNENKILALWPNASNQGETAGLNMTGKKQKAPATFAMNAISFFGMQIISAGIINSGGDGGGAYSDISGSKLRKLNIAHDNLIGFILINDNQRAGIYTALINDRTRLSSLEYDIKEKNIGLNVYPKEMRTGKIWGKI
jgi:NAD(P)H-nitrite reductase large subunit